MVCWVWILIAIHLMFSLNRLYIFYASNITLPIAQNTSPFLVNDVRTIEPTDF